MREIHTADKLLKKLLPPQKLKNDKNYVKSRFTIDFQYEGRPFIFSTLTGQCFELPFVLDKAHYPFAEIEANVELTELAKAYFLVPEDMDENVFYLGISNMMKAYFRKKYRNAYTILPTLGCNARCVYCYEEGLKPVTMTEKTADDTIDFIARTHRKDAPVILQWFGGEPLANVRIIDRIIDGLIENKVDFVSTIVTNGSLITDELIDRMVNVWQLKKVQISFDGAEPDYIKRKCYIKYDDTYNRVLRSASLISQRGVQVVLRCNVDLDNIGDIPQVIADAAAAIKNKENFRIYFAPLNQARESEGIEKLQEMIYAANDLLPAAGLKSTDPTALRTTFRIFRCMSDDPTGSVVILPDGGLCTCLYTKDEFTYGSLTEGVTRPDILQKFIVAGPIREQCKNCVFLPQCTAFPYCPVVNKLCFDQRMRIAKSFLPQLAARAEKHGTEESVNPEVLGTEERLRTDGDYLD